VASDGDGNAVTEVAAAAPATPFAPAQSLIGRPIASSSRPMAGHNGVGGMGTGLLLLTFSGVLLLGRSTRQR
jgi:hypothetical protein